MESRFIKSTKLIFIVLLFTNTIIGCSSKEEGGRKSRMLEIFNQQALYGVYTYKDIETYGWIEITISEGKWQSKSTTGFMSFNRVQQDTMQGLIKGTELFDRTRQKKISFMSNKGIVATLGSISAGWTGFDYSTGQVPVLLKKDF